jgi:hypothetical protein
MIELADERGMGGAAGMRMSSWCEVAVRSATPFLVDARRD